MDTITHGITGALLGKAFFSETGGAAFRLRKAENLEAAGRLKPARLAVWAATLGAIAPDSDSLFEGFVNDDLAIIEQHRGFTHSFLFLPLFALILAAVTHWLARRRNWPAPSLG